MKKIKRNEIKEFKLLLEEIDVTSEFTKKYLFFPIELDADLIQTDSGIAMFNSSNALQTGANALIQYGLLLESGNADIYAVAYADSSTMQLNLKDLSQIIEFDEKLKDLECRIIPESSLLFGVNTWN